MYEHKQPKVAKLKKTAETASSMFTLLNMCGVRCVSDYFRKPSCTQRLL